jgi:hypothetical protein
MNISGLQKRRDFSLVEGLLFSREGLSSVGLVTNVYRKPYEKKTVHILMQVIKRKKQYIFQFCS